MKFNKNKANKSVRFSLDSDAPHSRSTPYSQRPVMRTRLAQERAALRYAHSIDIPPAIRGTMSQAIQRLVEEVDSEQVFEQLRLRRARIEAASARSAATTYEPSDLEKELIRRAEEKQAQRDAAGESGCAVNVPQQVQQTATDQQTDIRELRRALHIMAISAYEQSKDTVGLQQELDGYDSDATVAEGELDGVEVTEAALKMSRDVTRSRKVRQGMQDVFGDDGDEYFESLIDDAWLASGDLSASPRSPTSSNANAEAGPSNGPGTLVAAHSARSASRDGSEEPSGSPTASSHGLPSTSIWSHKPKRYEDDDYDNYDDSYSAPVAGPSNGPGTWVAAQDAQGASQDGPEDLTGLPTDDHSPRSDWHRMTEFVEDEATPEAGPSNGPGTLVAAKDDRNGSQSDSEDLAPAPPTASCDLYSASSYPIPSTSFYGPLPTSALSLQNSASDENSYTRTAWESYTTRQDLSIEADTSMMTSEERGEYASPYPVTTWDQPAQQYAEYSAAPQSDAMEMVDDDAEFIQMALRNSYSYQNSGTAFASVTVDMPMDAPEPLQSASAPSIVSGLSAGWRASSTVQQDASAFGQSSSSFSGAALAPIYPAYTSSALTSFPTSSFVSSPFAGPQTLFTTPYADPSLAFGNFSQRGPAAENYLSAPLIPSSFQPVEFQAPLPSTASTPRSLARSGMFQFPLPHPTTTPALVIAAPLLESQVVEAQLAEHAEELRDTTYTVNVPSARSSTRHTDILSDTGNPVLFLGDYRRGYPLPQLSTGEEEDLRARLALERSSSSDEQPPQLPRRRRNKAGSRVKPYNVCRSSSGNGSGPAPRPLPPPLKRRSRVRAARDSERSRTCPSISDAVEAMKRLWQRIDTLQG